MDTTNDDLGAHRPPGDPAASAATAIIMALALGLACGYLDIAIIVLRKFFWNQLRNYENGADFPWSVPLGHAILLAIPGLLLAAIGRLRPKPIAPRASAWSLASLALWSALLRMPLYGAATLVLAMGLGRLSSGAIAAHFLRARRAWLSLAVLAVPVIVVAVTSTGWKVLSERRAVAALPTPAPGARNVLLVVWDTVRAGNLGLYGYPRPTTPNLARWARKGVRYGAALAAAPWTYPSHGCFFTGRWPFQFNADLKFTLDPSLPTLAEYLASRGYQTAGFSANTACCSYEMGLDRGFARFEDYPLTPRSLLTRTVAGTWILQNVFARDDYYEAKWLRSQSRNAAAVHDAFLDWLGHRRPDRPFFAFLNEFDAHAPYVPPPGHVGRFGIRPQRPRDYRFLLDYGDAGVGSIQGREISMARDCYDDCIAYLDEQLGRLLDDLQGRGILDNTLVIIASDHGESFGDHGSFVHPTGVYLDEIAVPLVILSPDAPASRVVDEPVSLRDLPATVVDRLGLSVGSPFPGRSLAALWRPTSGSSAMEATPALSEYATPVVIRPRRESGLSRDGVLMSLVAQGRHYVRDGLGVEQLFDMSRDRFERRNLMDSAEGKPLAGRYRRMLLDALTKNPGSIEAERTYLEPYRRWLRSLVDGGPGVRTAISSRR